MKRPGAIRTSGFTLIELLIVFAIIFFLISISIPAIQASREAARRTQCSSNLRQLGVALQIHHDQRGHLPPALLWKPAGEPLGDGIAPPGTMDHVSLGQGSPQSPDPVYANWVILILPYLDEQTLQGTFDTKVPVADARNSVARATELPILKCPSDAWNGADNHFQRNGDVSPDAGYARGNFALNAGSNDRCLMNLSRVWPPGTCDDGFLVNGTDLKTNTSQLWGSGIGGVNKTFRFSEFPKGLTKTVAIEEIRAGIHPLDRRGVWALGFAGCSVTVAHGRTGNKGPNAGADDIQGCHAVSTAVPNLAGLRMPCTSSEVTAGAELSQQATSRSMHPDGVNLLMMDGSVHFVLDNIETNVWHQMHKRDGGSGFELPF